MRYSLLIFFIVLSSLNGIAQNNTGLRSGLNFCANPEDGSGMHVGYYLAGYANIETYRMLAYRVELKVQRIGYQVQEGITATVFYANLPILMDFNTEGNKKQSIYLGLEPGINLGGHKIPRSQLTSLKKTFNHKEGYSSKTFERNLFNIEAVMGGRVRVSKIDIYFLINAGLIYRDFYLSVGVGF